MANKRKSTAEEPKALLNASRNFDSELDSLFSSSAGPSSFKSIKVNHKDQVKKAKEAVKNLSKADRQPDTPVEQPAIPSSVPDNEEEDIDEETLKEFAQEIGRDADDLGDDDKNWEDDVDNKKKKSAPRVYQIENETAEQKNERTVFVGNIPAEAAKSKVRSLFYCICLSNFIQPLSKKLVRHLMEISDLPPTAKYDSIRFRSVAFSVPTSASAKSNADNKRYQTPKQKRKVAFIKQDLHPDAASVNAYVVFGYRRSNDVVLLNNKDKDIPPSEVAQKVVDAANGSTFEGRILRVDRVLNVDKTGTRWHIDKDMAKRTLYVGRLDFGQKDNELGEFIEKLLNEEKGTYKSKDADDKAKSWVRGVRIVRDPDTQLGKGFGYVHLADNDCVEELLLLPDERKRLNKRTLRFAKSKASGKQKPQEDAKEAEKKDKKDAKKSVTAKPGKIVKGDPNLGDKLADMTKEARKKTKAVDAVRQARRLAKKQQAVSKKQTDDKVKLTKTRKKPTDKKPAKNAKKTKKPLSDKALSKRNNKKKMEDLGSPKQTMPSEVVVGPLETANDSNSNPWSPWATYSANTQATTSSYLDGLVPDENFADEFEQQWMAHTSGSDVDMTIAALQKLLFRTELPARSVEKILGLTVRGRVVQKAEFKFALALAAYAQQGQELIIDVVTMAKPPIPYPKIVDMPEGVSQNDDSWTVATQAEMTETVIIRLEGEKEGFLFTHHNYNIESSRGDVSRRFSDFVWLHDCLLVRYPFRNIPNLPPKRLTVSGHSLSTDANFLETRRRGLQRYMNFILNHPILKTDGLVLTFLETPSLESWRKNTKVALEEESQMLNRVKAMSIPVDLDERIDKLKVRIPNLIDNWTTLCAQFERILKRNETDARDYITLSMTMGTVIESDSQSWGRGQGDTVSDNLTLAKTGLEEYASVAYNRTLQMSLQALEASRYVRDLYIAYLSLLSRYDKLTPHSVEKLKKNMERSQRKIQTLAQALEREGDLKQRRKFENEIHTQNTIIESAQVQIQHALTKRQFARYCVWTELIQLQHQETPLVYNVIRTLINSHIQKYNDSGSTWKALKEKLTVN
ncbi:hypothetical protein E3Q02_01562 [Wallemia mellicola]|uniref:Sorting nexin MVP1 n=1 Tax=Wallemia mellicola TaxID=1708541 RepID=A0AB38MYK2_9BASI|nr:hypothetical protein E3Q09_00540 [Wallemia mellicola]TIC57418.1 hypothetical protein E3Q04_00502 [Wallemia mellicola]TIC67200.1 hypothetical protein E3Q02_01562 [Wallemia mellicola]